MKYLHSDGNRLVVRDAGPVVYLVESVDGSPLPLIHHQFMDDGEAKAYIQGLLNRVPGRYRGVSRNNPT